MPFLREPRFARLSQKWHDDFGLVVLMRHLLTGEDAAIAQLLDKKFL
jgi:hypothetical protein